MFFQILTSISIIPIFSLFLIASKLLAAVTNPYMIQKKFQSQRNEAFLDSLINAIAQGPLRDHYTQQIENL